MPGVLDSLKRMTRAKHSDILGLFTKGIVMEQKVAALLSLALAVITDRLLTIIALGMTFALATWIMNNPDWLRLAAFGFFCFTA